MRKALLIIVTFLLLTVTASGAEYPVDKGSTIIYGMFSFSKSSGELYEDSHGNPATLITISPNFLTFIVPNFAVGLHAQMDHISQGGEKVSALSVGPTLALFAGGPDSKAYPYFSTGVAFLTSDLKEKSRDYWGHIVSIETHYSGEKFFFGAGVAFMLSSHLAMIFEGNYNVVKLRQTNQNSVFGNSFGVSVGLAGFIF
jgi:hypothetical protein